MSFLPQVFDPNQWDPSQTGGVGNFKVGPKQLMAIQSATPVNSKTNPNNMYMDLTVRLLDGEFVGKTSSLKLNLQNDSAIAVDIAHRKLSAICFAVGHPQPLQDLTAIFERPFRADVEPDEKNPDKYTNITTIYDTAGNLPTRNGQAIQQQPAVQNFQAAAPQQNFQQPQVQQQPQQGYQIPNQPPQQSQAPAQTGWGQQSQVALPAEQHQTNPSTVQSVQPQANAGLAAGWAGQQQPQGAASAWANQAQR